LAAFDRAVFENGHLKKPVVIKNCPLYIRKYPSFFMQNNLFQ